MRNRTAAEIQKKDFYGVGEVSFLCMISVIYTQQVQKGRCEKTQSSFFTSPFLRSNPASHGREPVNGLPDVAEDH